MKPRSFRKFNPHEDGRKPCYCNSIGVDCADGGWDIPSQLPEACERCGWNPEVEKRRKAQLERRLKTYGI